MEIIDNDDLLFERTVFERTAFDNQMNGGKAKITIALDFDCTVIECSYPNVGKSLPLCVETLRRWVNDYNVGLILCTMRDGKELEDAIKWFSDNQILLYGIQKHPTQENWTTSPKCHCSACIDDRNVGTKLKLDSNGVPCVDWQWLINEFEPTLKTLNKLYKN